MGTMNTYAVRAGDRFMDRDGKLYEVGMVFPAGGAGIAASSGPRVMLWPVIDGVAAPGRGASVTVQHGAHRTPDEFTAGY